MIFREDIDKIVTAIEKATDKLNTNQIDQNYFKEILELVNMKGDDDFKSIRIYWSGRWDLILPLEFLHHIECEDSCVVVHKSGSVFVIPYRNIDYVRLI